MSGMCASDSYNCVWLYCKVSRVHCYCMLFLQGTRALLGESFSHITLGGIQMYDYAQSHNAPAQTTGVHIHL